MHRFLPVAFLLPFTAAYAGGATELAAYVRALAATLPAPAQDALQRIEGEPRRLLAERAYLRAGDGLVRRWSWSDEQIAAFVRTPSHRAFLDEVARVQARFSEQNPGYTLGAGTEVRSLEVQLQRWNENPSVERVAAHLHDDAMLELRRSRIRRPGRRAVDTLRGFLRRGTRRSPRPGRAGLSLHGQLRAVDFHVERDGRLVASTEVASVRSVWEQQGWALKLRAALRGSRFLGPLKSPNEPWHYEYAPSAEQSGGRVNLRTAIAGACVAAGLAGCASTSTSAVRVDKSTSISRSARRSRGSRRPRTPLPSVSNVCGRR